MISVPLEPTEALMLDSAEPGSLKSIAQVAQCILMNIEEVPNWNDDASMVTNHCHATVIRDDALALAAAPSPAGGRVLSVDALSYCYALLGASCTAEAATIWEDNPEHRKAAHAEIAALSHPVSGGGEGHGALAPLVPTAQSDGPVVGLPTDLAPRDGRPLRLLVRYSEDEPPGHWTPLEDAFESWTIGHNSFDNTGEDEWLFVGWDWSQDYYLQAPSGTVIAWLPFHEPAPEKVICATCRGYGFARGGSCWTCGGSGIQAHPAPAVAPSGGA